MHLMTTYDENGTEVASPCDCWFGRSHLGAAVRGLPVVTAAISCGDLTVMPGHQHWSASRGCECGQPCPSIEYWQAHIESL
jgi:hypothetical protein